MKLYPVRLLQTAMIAGKPRSPAEGLQMVSAAERDRLVENNQAEDADADVDQDGGEGDGLDAMTIPALRKVAGAEGIDIAGKGKKAELIQAIRDHRSTTAEGDGLGDLTEDQLRQIADDEEIPVEEDADQAVLVAAIREARSPKE